MEGIPLVEKRWVRDEQGVAHAIREAEGEHHSAMCGKYVRGTPEPPGQSHRHTLCWKCAHRLKKCLLDVEEEYVPRVVLLGRGWSRAIRDVR